MRPLRREGAVVMSLPHKSLNQSPVALPHFQMLGDATAARDAASRQVFLYAETINPAPRSKRPHIDRPARRGRLAQGR